MKRIFFVLIVVSFICHDGYAQTLVVNPQNNDKEGGEILLKNSHSNYKPWHIDNYAGNLRFFRTGQVLFNMNPSGIISKISVDKIGIGTTNPRGKLHVNGDLFANMGEGFRLFGDVNYFGQWLDAVIFEMQDSNHTLGRTDGGFVFRGFTPSDNKHTDWMVIKSGGKVGIGTTTPTDELSVNGTIRSKEVTVEATSWPDYVFEKEYDLKSLEEIENYISKNGHLPNIPSAKEISKEGVKLGEMNVKLLEKIEELTLYTLQQQKELENQKSKIDTLQEENKVFRQLEIKLLDLQSRLDKIESNQIKSK